MQSKGNIRYYDAGQARTYTPPAKIAMHSEFLRTGRIARPSPIWIPDERRYLTYEQVAERTGKKLETAGEKTHERMNSFHRAIQFPKVIFHRTLAEKPHLGYCHITAARSLITQGTAVSWSFYIANFFSEISEDEHFFAKINQAYSRMYFAVALESEPGAPLKINRALRKNGLLFQTNDPKEAMRNVLMLGAPDKAAREIIKKL